MKITSSFILLFAILTFLSCKSDRLKTIVDAEQIAEEAIEDFENYRLKLNLEDSNVLEFPSPVELAANYKKSGMKYIPGITNPSHQFENYEIKTDTIGDYKRTIALWTDKESPNISSVNFEPINKEINSNELSIGIKSNMEFDKDELKVIFERSRGYFRGVVLGFFTR